MNRFAEELIKVCVLNKIFTKEDFFEECLQDIVHPGWYFIDFYNLHNHTDETHHKIIDVIDFAANRPLKYVIDDYLADDTKVVRIKKNLYELVDSGSYLVHVHIPKKELPLAYLTVRTS